jgi:hypothetical protein
MVRGSAGYGALLRNRPYVAYLVAAALGDAGYAIYALGITWLTLEVSGSAFVTALVLALEFGVYALSFVAGPFVDRIADLRTVLLIGYPLQAVFAGAIGFLAVENELTVPLLFALVAVLSLTWDFTWTASQAIPPRLLRRGELFHGGGLAGAISGGNAIAGYSAGGALLLIVGSPGAGMLLYGAFNAAAAVATLWVHAPLAERPTQSLAEEMREGWRYVASTRDPPIPSLLGWSTAQALFSAASVLLLTLTARNSFSDPSFAYGILFTAFAIGGIAGSLALGAVSPRRWVGPTLAIATVLDGGLLVLALHAAPSLALSVPAWAMVGFADGAFYSVLLVFLQATTPTRLIGRVTSNAYLFRGTSRAAGVVLLGAMAAFLTVPTIGLLVGIFFLGVGLGAPAVFPTLRRLSF